MVPGVLNQQTVLNKCLSFFFFLFFLSSFFLFFLLRARAFLKNLAEGPFCYLLFKDSILLFRGAWLTWPPSLANVCPELKILFQISSDEKVLFFGAKGSDQSFGLFFFLSISSGHATTMNYIPFSIQPIIGHGVLVAFV